MKQQTYVEEGASYVEPGPAHHPRDIGLDRPVHLSKVSYEGLGLSSTTRQFLPRSTALVAASKFVVLAKRDCGTNGCTGDPDATDDDRRKNGAHDVKGGIVGWRSCRHSKDRLKYRSKGQQAKWEEGNQKVGGVIE